MIQATVTGNLGRKPELKDTRTGKKMATFSVASTTKRDGKDPETTWLDVVCFDELAEAAAANFDKGCRVVMTGQLALETYQRKDGGEGVSLRMVAQEIGMTVRTRQEPKEESRPQRREDSGSEGRRPW